MAAENTTTPSLVESPATNAPVPAPEIPPLKVAVLVVAAASLFVPVVNTIVLLMVLEAVFNKVPLARVMLPDDKLLPLVPPEATDKVTPLMVVPRV